MKLEVSEESETDPEMSNSALYYKMKVLEEAYAEMSSRLSEERMEEIQADYESKINTAKTQAISTAKLQAFPIGSIFTSTISTNPSSYIGGSWEAYGSGKTLVGGNTNDSNFNTVSKTGGSSTTTLTTANLPSHTHSIPSLNGTTASAGAHTHSIPSLSGTTNKAGNHNHNAIWSYETKHAASGSAVTYVAANVAWTNNPNFKTSTNGNHSHTVTTNSSTSGATAAHTHAVTTNSSTSGSAGSTTAFTNLQPYITVYFWKRIR